MAENRATSVLTLQPHPKRPDQRGKDARRRPNPEVIPEADLDPARADLALLRLSAPYEERPGRFESFFHAGPLDFDAGPLAEILRLLATVPTVVAIHLERPAVIPEISAAAGAVLAVCGASDAALRDVVFGRAEPRGRLPIQLPRSMDEVRRGRPDVPRESGDPLFDYGDGLSLDPPAAPRGRPLR